MGDAIDATHFDTARYKAMQSPGQDIPPSSPLGSARPYAPAPAAIASPYSRASGSKGPATAEARRHSAYSSPGSPAAAPARVQLSTAFLDGEDPTEPGGLGGVWGGGIPSMRSAAGLRATQSEVIQGPRLPRPHPGNGAPRPLGGAAAMAGGVDAVAAGGHSRLPTAFLDDHAQPSVLAHRPAPPPAHASAPPTPALGPAQAAPAYPRAQLEAGMGGGSDLVLLMPAGGGGGGGGGGAALRGGVAAAAAAAGLDVRVPALEPPRQGWHGAGGGGAQSSR
jgi:translation initiation factor IF-2